MLVTDVSGVKYKELVEIKCRLARNVAQGAEVGTDNALVQLFEGSDGINMKNTKVRFLGKPRNWVFLRI